MEGNEEQLQNAFLRISALEAKLQEYAQHIENLSMDNETLRERLRNVETSNNSGMDLNPPKILKKTNQVADACNATGSIRPNSTIANHNNFMPNKNLSTGFSNNMNTANAGDFTVVKLGTHDANNLQQVDCCNQICVYEHCCKHFAENKNIAITVFGNNVCVSSEYGTFNCGACLLVCMCCLHSVAILLQKRKVVIMWDRDLTKKLIEEYENHTVLWDVSSADYKNKNKKQNAYREISEKLEKNEEEIKTKIHHLRTQFMQEVRREKQKKSGQGTSENYTSKWEFFDALKFITNDKGTNYKIQSLDLNESTVDKIVLEEGPCSANSSTTKDDVPNTSNAKKRKREDVQFKDEDLLIKTACSVMNKPADDHQVFGDFVASELRLLKSNQNILLLRRKIQRAILEVSEIDSEGTSNAFSSNSNTAYSSTNSPVFSFADGTYAQLGNTQAQCLQSYLQEYEKETSESDMNHL